MAFWLFPFFPLIPFFSLFPLWSCPDLVDTSISEEEVFMAKQPFAKKRRKPEFKLEAVRQLRERLAAGLTLQRVSEELDVGPDLLRQWAKQVDGAPPGAPASEIFPGPGQRRRFRSAATMAASEQPPSLDDEVRQLRRENDRLRQERDFLKKAAAFFAKESR